MSRDENLLNLPPAVASPHTKAVRVSVALRDSAGFLPSLPVPQALKGAEQDEGNLMPGEHSELGEQDHALGLGKMHVYSVLPCYGVGSSNFCRKFGRLGNNCSCMTMLGTIQTALHESFSST